LHPQMKTPCGNGGRESGCRVAPPGLGSPKTWARRELRKRQARKIQYVIIEVDKQHTHDDLHWKATLPISQQIGSGGNGHASVMCHGAHESTHMDPAYGKRTGLCGPGVGNSTSQLGVRSYSPAVPPASEVTCSRSNTVVTDCSPQASSPSSDKDYAADEEDEESETEQEEAVCPSACKSPARSPTASTVASTSRASDARKDFVISQLTSDWLLCPRLFATCREAGIEADIVRKTLSDGLRDGSILGEAPFPLPLYVCVRGAPGVRVRRSE